VVHSRRGWTRAAATILVCSLPLLAQEPAPGRGGRGGNSSESTRVFLGLGPAPDREAAKKGDPLFAQNCAGCHGDKGRGGQAPSLVRSVLVLHDEKGTEIGPLVHNGRPQAGMPAFPNLTQDELYSLSQYIHLQVELVANRGSYGATYSGVRSQVTGDARQGEEFFNGAGGCGKCHSITGDLAHIGTRIPQAAALRSRFLWPATPGPAVAKVTLASGETVTGKIRKLSDFDVILADAAGNVHYWPRREVRVELEDPLAAHRALLAKYTDADIHNLTAYLVTLK